MPIEIRELEVHMSVTPTDATPTSGRSSYPEHVSNLTVQELIDLINSIVMSRLIERER